jgi:subtilisin family serine protease
MDVDGALSVIDSTLPPSPAGQPAMQYSVAPNGAAPVSRIDNALADLSKTPEQLRAELPAEPEKQGGILRNIGAGANEAIASTVGAPVDAMTWALNQGAHGINALAGTTLPDIANPVGGSDSIKALMGVAGADPRNVGANSGIDRIARGTGSGIVSMSLRPPLLGLSWAGWPLASFRGSRNLLPMSACQRERLSERVLVRVARVQLRRCRINTNPWLNWVASLSAAALLVVA